MRLTGGQKLEGRSWRASHWAKLQREREGAEYVCIFHEQVGRALCIKPAATLVGMEPRRLESVCWRIAVATLTFFLNARPAAFIQIASYILQTAKPKAHGELAVCPIPPLAGCMNH